MPIAYCMIHFSELVSWQLASPIVVFKSTLATFMLLARETLIAAYIMYFPGKIIYPIQELTKELHDYSV